MPLGEYDVIGNKVNFAVAPPQVIKNMWNIDGINYPGGVYSYTITNASGETLGTWLSSSSENIIYLDASEVNSDETLSYTITEQN